MPTPARRRRSNVPVLAPVSESPRRAMEIAPVPGALGDPVLAALGDRTSAVPTVLVRLRLLAPDEVTGEPRLVGSFLRPISMPPDLASPRVSIALEIFGERHVFKPTDIIWDEPRQVCIVEVAWGVADAASIVGGVRADERRASRRKQAPRDRNPAGRTMDPGRKAAKRTGRAGPV